MPFPTPHNSTITLLAGVPLDNTYRHTIYFASAAAQQSYFASKAVSGLSWTDCMYHRETAAIRVNAPIDDVENVNYVMFQNTSYASKWFYAFVTEHTYINANCTELKIQLDVLQTYYFDYQMLPCFIDRQHTTTDQIGDNLVPENLQIGEYVVNRVHGSTCLGTTKWDIIAWSPYELSSYTDLWGGNYRGTFSGLTGYPIGTLTLGSKNNYSSSSDTWTIDPSPKLQILKQSHPDILESIVAITMYPHNFYSNYTNVHDRTVFRESFNKPYTSINGYIPKNKKLFTSPYNVLSIDDGVGNGGVYQYEFFNDGSDFSKYVFDFIADYQPNPTIGAIPIGYKLIPNGASDTTYLGNLDEYATLSNMAQCPWLSDPYKSYLAQNTGSMVISSAINLLQIAGGVATIVGTEGAGTAVGVGMIAGGVTGIANTINNNYKASLKPKVSHGSISDTFQMTLRRKDFIFAEKSITYENARIVDDFFSMYGYAIHKIDVPNTHARPHWTYIKTINSVAAPASGAGAPAGALAEIQRIYDNGITFWVNGSEVGDYSLNNTV